jgi:outer membrane protein TolC
MQLPTIRSTLLLAIAFAMGTGSPRILAQPGQAQVPRVERLTIDEAVRLALENNLGVQVARIGPQVQDLTIAQALGAWSPTFTGLVEAGSVDTPTNSFLSGSIGPKTSDNRITSNTGIRQLLPWGGSYSVGWDSSRSTTTNVFSNFSPQLRSSLALTYTQPLMRNFGIDGARQQLLLSRTSRTIADVQVRETVSTTSRSVRHAYWELVYAIASLEVQRQSRDLAQESLRNTRARVEIGMTAPIDVVEAESELAQREEGVILAEAAIESAQDTLRALVYDPSMPDFWSIRIEPIDPPPFEQSIVDVDIASRNALSRRSDVDEARRTLEADDISIRYLRNQTLPDVTANIDYGLTGLGGTQFLRGSGFPGPVIGQTERGFGSVLADLLGNDFPSWTVSLNLSYPIGSSEVEASLARARLQYSQSQTQLRNLQLQVTTEVREVARQVQTNQKRVDSTRAARQLAERRLDAEERKFMAGTSTSFFVFQAQRDLSQARGNELRAILDYNRSLVDLETVQEAPLTPR